MCRKVLVFVFAFYPLLAIGQVAFRNKLTAESRVTMNDTYELGVGLHRMLYKYIGIGGYIGYWSAFSDGGMIRASDDNNSDRSANAFIKPTVLLKYPNLFSLRECTFSFQCESGLMISARQWYQAALAGTEKNVNYHTDCLSWHFSAGLSAQYHSIGLSIFYSISNMDINRKYTNHLNEDKYEKCMVNGIGFALDFYF